MGHAGSHLRAIAAGGFTPPPASHLGGDGGPRDLTPLGLRIMQQGGTAHGQAVLHLHVHRNCPTSMPPGPVPGA